MGYYDNWYDDYDDSIGFNKNKKKSSQGYSSYNYDYGYNYGKKSQKKSSFSWGWDSWWDEKKDDSIDKQLIIKDPEAYVTPTKSDMGAKRNVILGGTKYSGSYQTQKIAYSGYEITDESAKFIKNLSRFFYHDMFDVPQEEMFIEGAKPEDIQFYDQFFDKIKHIQLPYNSPLDKAIFYHNKIAKEAIDAQKDVQKTFQQPKEVMTLAEQMNIDEETLNDLELQKTIQDCVLPGGLKGGDPLDLDSARGFEIKEKHNADIQSVIEKVSLIKSFGDAFTVSKEVTKEPIYNSPIKDYLPMTSIEQMIHADMYKMLFPDFHYKMATNNLYVNMPIRKEEKKQKIIILLDDSGLLNLC